MSVTIACQDLKFNNIAAIIFDKDGTLENSASYWLLVAAERARLIDAQIPGVGEPLKMAFGILDRNLDPHGLMAVGSRYENEIAAAAYIAETGKSWCESKEIAHSAFTEVAESKYLSKNPKSAPLYDDVRETLQSLKNRELKIGILSADSTQEVTAFVTNHQLQDYLQLCMGIDNEMTKPDPRLFLQACEKLQVLPEQTLMIGDTAADMVMAQTAGAAGRIGICRSQNWQLDSANRQINSLLEIQAL
ncbi:MAG: HAD family hydrolase [Cyanobacteria bacterium P01_E01_bin.35]